MTNKEKRNARAEKKRSEVLAKMKGGAADGQELTTATCYCECGAQAVLIIDTLGISQNNPNCEECGRFNWEILESPEREVEKLSEKEATDAVFAQAG